MAKRVPAEATRTVFVCGASHEPSRRNGKVLGATYSPRRSRNSLATSRHVRPLRRNSRISSRCGSNFERGGLGGKSPGWAMTNCDSELALEREAVMVTPRMAIQSPQLETLSRSLGGSLGTSLGDPKIGSPLSPQYPVSSRSWGYSGLPLVPCCPILTGISSRS